MPQVFVSIGSNIDAEQHVRFGVTALRVAFGALTISPIYRTPAVGFVGDDFLNLVVGLTTDLSPTQIVSVLREIEAANGRGPRSVRFSARTLDLDLLNYGDAIINEAGVQLPRDEITRYAFVLMPLADIASDWVHPVAQQTIGQLWAAFTKPALAPIVVGLDLQRDVILNPN